MVVLGTGQFMLGSYRTSAELIEMNYGNTRGPRRTFGHSGIDTLHVSRSQFHIQARSIRLQ